VWVGAVLAQPIWVGQVPSHQKKKEKVKLTKLG